VLELPGSLGFNPVFENGDPRVQNIIRATGGPVRLTGMKTSEFLFIYEM